MRDPELIHEYRALDRDCALFHDKLASWRTYETRLFIPDIAAKSALEGELGALKSRTGELGKPDDVFDMLREHMIDFLNGQKMELQYAYERPSRHMGAFLETFCYFSRMDSRPEVQKAEILLKRFSQADDVWRGVTTWIDSVSFLNLQELVYDMQTYIDIIEGEITRVPEYFPGLGERRQGEIVRAARTLAEKISGWILFVQTLMQEKGMKKAGTTSESDTVGLDESCYRSVLWDVMGVSLDEILSWYEIEIEKTRNEVYEIAGKIKIPDPVPTTMAGVNDLLLKYAGPCDTPEEMYERANAYIKRSQAACKGYVWLPDDETCLVKKIPEQYKRSYPWGGYAGGCPLRRPLQGEMFLNNYNYKAITDGWIKMNTVHEAYPGHHVQFVRATLDSIPETVKIGAKQVPISEGTAHRAERAFEFIFPEDPFYPLFVAYRRHHTSVRIKADLLLRYFGRPIGEAVQLYVDELGFDRATARGQVRAQEGVQGYFTTYYYGMKKLCDWEKKYGFDAKTYTELLFSAGRISLESFEKFLKMSESDKHSYLHDFPGMLQFAE